METETWITSWNLLPPGWWSIPGLFPDIEGLLLWVAPEHPSGIAFSLLGVVILLACSALISSSEVAYFSLSPSDFYKLKEEQSRASQRILVLSSRPRVLLATILISNNFINIGIVILSEYMLRGVLPEALTLSWGAAVSGWFGGLSWLSDATIGRMIHVLITVIGVTFLLVLFGEVAPKVYAKVNNVKLARFMSTPLLVLQRLFSPFSQLLVRSSAILEKGLRKNGQSAAGQESTADIHEAIELTVRQDKGGRQEIDILKSIIDFSDVTVKQIMRSRVDVIAVDFRSSYSELLQVVKKSGFSRIPVYDEDLDNITGILYVKDLLEFLEENDQFEWQELIRTEILYTPEAKRIQELLKEFQAKRLHMALVVDEYGGFSGIVTLEDILEEIIGDIRDEFDEDEEVDYEQLDSYNYVFEGRTLLIDVCRVVDLEPDIFDTLKGDADSIAGLVLEQVGILPRRGLELRVGEFTLKVLAVNKRRIEKVKLTLPRRQFART